MRRFIILSTIVTLALAGGVAMHAQGQNRNANRADGPRLANVGQRAGAPGRMGPGQRGNGLMGFGLAARNLDLTDEQQAQIDTIVVAARDKSGPLADQLRLAESSLHREVFAASRDDAAITELAGQVSTLRQQIADLRVETMTAVAALLTPEQREQVRVGPTRDGRGGPGGRGGRS